MDEGDTDVSEGHEIKWERHREGKGSDGGSHGGNEAQREQVRLDDLSRPQTYLFWNKAEPQLASAFCIQESRFS